MKYFCFGMAAYMTILLMMIAPHLDTQKVGPSLMLIALFPAMMWTLWVHIKDEKP